MGTPVWADQFYRIKSQLITHFHSLICYALRTHPRNMVEAITESSTKLRCNLGGLRLRLHLVTKPMAAADFKPLPYSRKTGRARWRRLLSQFLESSAARFSPSRLNPLRHRRWTLLQRLGKKQPGEENMAMNQSSHEKT